MFYNVKKIIITIITLVSMLGLNSVYAENPDDVTTEMQGGCSKTVVLLHSLLFSYNL